MKKLNNPTLFCHKLTIDPATSKITDFHMRQPDPKRKSKLEERVPLAHARRHETRTARTVLTDFVTLRHVNPISSSVISVRHSVRRGTRAVPCA